ncbi:MAG: S-layer homology domain-containing protein [Oscillospiraceae bacterium]|nr:S-layer homology domain-containing protein [Oscillospiraceae bacterium]
MKRKSMRILALLCALYLLCIPACAASEGEGEELPGEGRFSDVSENEWFYEPVTYLAEKGILCGFEDGTFRPKDTLTEAQLVKLMLKPWMPEEVEEPEGSGWWKPYAEFGLREGILTGEDVAGINAEASRLRVALLLARLPLLPDSDDYRTAPNLERILPGIVDMEEIPEEARDAVILVYAAGLMEGYEDGCFHPERTLTRAEGAAVIQRLLLPEKRMPKLRYAVPEEWFSDALILGNSHCGGLSMYGDMPCPDFCFSYGGSIFTGLSTVCRDRHERSFTLRSLLEEKQYAKIILIYGTNEMGYDIYYLRPFFAAFLDKLAETQPEAEIWLCTAPPVNPEMARSEDQETEIFTVENCRAVNALITELAEAKGMGLIDVYGLFADEEGILPPEFTGDGIHLTRECYRAWGRWLAVAVGTDTPAEEELSEEEEPSS